jgi:hypothetical protein
LYMFVVGSMKFNSRHSTLLLKIQRKCPPLVTII